MNAHGNEVHINSKEGSIKSQFVIDSINNWAETITKPTILVLDNAPIHKAKIFQEKMIQWQEKNLYIFFLPAYSPHLNRIETLWRKTNGVARAILLYQTTRLPKFRYLKRGS